MHTNTRFPHVRNRSHFLPCSQENFLEKSSYLPNILHLKIQDQLHTSLQSLLDSDLPRAAPIVIIISDAGVRSEAMDERMSAGGSGETGRDSGVIDMRNVLPSGLLPSVCVSPYVFHSLDRC